MRVLLLGASGQVGRELHGPLSSFAEVAAPARDEAPLDDLGRLRDAVRATAADVIVNCAAWNDVDGAERDEAGALQVNRDAVALLGEEARGRGGALVHFSTDYAFDGEQQGPYHEADPVSPLSAYARSKVAGERALADLDAPAVVLRTAWVYSLGRKNFVTSILRAARERDELLVVDDQSGHPTSARDLAAATALILRRPWREGESAAADRVAGALREARGIYHAVNAGVCTRYQLAQTALALDPGRAAHIARRITPARATDFPSPARRPRHVLLDGSKLRERFGIALPPWRDALARTLRDL